MEFGIQQFVIILKSPNGAIHPSHCMRLPLVPYMVCAISEVSGADIHRLTSEDKRTTTITVNDNRRLDLTQSVTNDWGGFKDRFSAKSNQINFIGSKSSHQSHTVHKYNHTESNVQFTNEPPHDNTNKMLVRPAKIQISPLGLRPV